MRDPHNYRGVGWSMVVVAGALATIGLLALTVGHDPYFTDKTLKQKQAEFVKMKEMESQMQNQSVEQDEKLKAEATQGGMFILDAHT